MEQMDAKQNIASHASTLKTPVGCIFVGNDYNKSLAWKLFKSDIRYLGDICAMSPSDLLIETDATGADVDYIKKVIHGCFGRLLSPYPYRAQMSEATYEIKPDPVHVKTYMELCEVINDIETGRKSKTFNARTEKWVKNVNMLKLIREFSSRD